MLLKDEKLKGHKYVKDYFIEKYPSGIYLICFNTRKQYESCHAASDDTYIFGDSDNDYETQLIHTKQFLPENERFITTKNVCKDQISFYYIPFKLIEDEDEK